MILIIWTIIFLLVLAVVFMCGRKYERKQFIRIGKKRPSTQDILLGGKNEF